jgi:uncharacterized protein (DUF302 family)
MTGEVLMKNAAAKANIKEISYGYARDVDAGFDEAVERTREALKSEGFGVLSEIRMDEKFNEKLGVDFRKYVILGACNPPLAYKTVQEDINIGLLLPCNVVVYESADPGNARVAAIDAEAMMSLVGDKPDIAAAAKEVNEKLRKVLTGI